MIVHFALRLSSTEGAPWSLSVQGSAGISVLGIGGLLKLVRLKGNEIVEMFLCTPKRMDFALSAVILGSDLSLPPIGGV